MAFSIVSNPFVEFSFKIYSQNKNYLFFFFFFFFFFYFNTIEYKKAQHEDAVHIDLERPLYYRREGEMNQAKGWKRSAPGSLRFEGYKKCRERGRLGESSNYLKSWGRIGE